MAAANTHLVYVIAGPTASGKSALALALAERIGGVVINGDSMQVYRGVERLTDQPDAAARARAPHRLYGILDPADSCSAGRWRTLALAEIEAALGQGLVPIVVGGSGLYLKALIEGIAPIPEIPAAIRRAVRERHAALGNQAFHADLAARDPESAGRIRASDPQRMIRAMEVLEATGRSLADWQAEPADGPPPGLAFRTVLLMPPRAELYAAIDARVESMAEAGGLEEAWALAARGLAADAPVMKALGLADLAAACRGEVPLAAAIDRAKTATRNYAKRQVTWFQGQMVADLTLNTKFSESFKEKMLSEIL
ncbi:MAG: tRNA (adenosine(37)-N6)-dimethylallyltransferase MiaA [Alphaproteobacteria bacterium]|nr:tRNA (adenosine(37)-N6)-dimethylallyltransferase MiaA [Alphaproteobacteria bacterium]